MISKADLFDDVPERRAVAQAFEVKSAGDNIAKITGYASVFDRGYDVHGGPNSGGWTESVSRSAFKKTLSDKPHVHLLINHAQDGGLPLASTKSGTLRLSTDSTGLITEAEVDRRNSRANDMVLTLERGDADEMSFAFRVKHNTWSDDETQRSLEEVSLHKGDVSVVGFGANPFTSVGVRNAVRMLARQEFSDKEMAELRAMGADVDRAIAALSRADSPGPFADPGYLDVDDNQASKSGKKGLPRYPVGDKAHAANAASRFAQNKDRYTPEQQKHILGAIHAAEEKFGITPGEKNSLRAAPSPDWPAGGHARQIHDMAILGGADCDPSAARAMAAGEEDGDVFDDDADESRDSLMQAVHDLVADASGAHDEGGFDDLGEEGDDSTYDSQRAFTVIDAVKEFADTVKETMTLVDAVKELSSPGNLSLAEAVRLCRPVDSPEPFSVEDAERLAS